MLGDEELLKPPYSIQNQIHRRAVLAELERVKAFGVKPPQNLWEYKVKEFGMLHLHEYVFICKYLSYCWYRTVLLCSFRKVNMKFLNLILIFFHLAFTFVHYKFKGIVHFFSL